MEGRPEKSKLDLKPSRSVGATRLDSTRSNAGPPGPCEGVQADHRQQPGRGRKNPTTPPTHSSARLGNRRLVLAPHYSAEALPCTPCTWPRVPGSGAEPRKKKLARRATRRSASRSRRRSSCSAAALAPCVPSMPIHKSSCPTLICQQVRSRLFHLKLELRTLDFIAVPAFRR